MKKKFLLIIVLIIGIIITYGSYVVLNNKDDDIKSNESYEINENEIIKEKPKQIWEDNNPITIGIYKYDNKKNKRILTSEYTNIWKYHTDIVSFNVMYTNDEEISSGKLADVYETFLDSYTDIEDYRIGYIIKFETNDGMIEKQILRPSDTEDFYEYIEVYLYDAIYHRNDKWYSHTTEKEYNEDTLLEGIKLTSGVKINKVISDITLTAFTFDDDDFDEIGIYKGISKYTVIVKKA